MLKLFAGGLCGIFFIPCVQKTDLKIILLSCWLRGIFLIPRPQNEVTLGGV